MQWCWSTVNGLPTKSMAWPEGAPWSTTSSRVGLEGAANPWIGGSTPKQKPRLGRPGYRADGRDIPPTLSVRRKMSSRCGSAEFVISTAVLTQPTRSTTVTVNPVTLHSGGRNHSNPMVDTDTTGSLGVRPTNRRRSPPLPSLALSDSLEMVGGRTERVGL